MRMAQKVVLFVGVLLLALNFTFPISSYKTVSEPRKLPSDDGGTPRWGVVTVSKKTWFLPIWTALAQREKQKKADPSRNTYFDTIIHWDIVFALAGFIICVCAIPFLSLGRKGKHGSRESPITQEGA